MPVRSEILCLGGGSSCETSRPDSLRDLMGLGVMSGDYIFIIGHIRDNLLVSRSNFFFSPWRFIVKKGLFFRLSGTLSFCLQCTLSFWLECFRSRNPNMRNQLVS